MVGKSSKRRLTGMEVGCTGSARSRRMSSDVVYVVLSATS
jgi:hypothetical protein